jgi:hypothetical protein
MWLFVSTVTAKTAGKYTALSWGTLYSHGDWKSSHYTTPIIERWCSQFQEGCVLRKDSKSDFHIYQRRCPISSLP